MRSLNKLDFLDSTARLIFKWTGKTRVICYIAALSIVIVAKYWCGRSENILLYHILKEVKKYVKSKTILIDGVAPCLISLRTMEPVFIVWDGDSNSGTVKLECGPNSRHIVSQPFQLANPDVIKHLANYIQTHIQTTTFNAFYQESKATS